MANDQNYTLPRGKVFFAREEAGVLGNFRYIGNTPEFNITISQENLDHFSSDAGVREKDESIILQTDRTGTLVTDSIQFDNLALFLLGTTATVTTVGATVTDEEHDDVVAGEYIQLGYSAANPSGARGISITGFTVEDDTTPTPVEFDIDDDYTIDLNTGLLYVVPGGAITDGTNLRVTYTTEDTTHVRAVSGSIPVAGAIKYIADNATGDNRDLTIPSVKITPNGDFALKGDDWQQISFNLEILKPATSEAFIVDGRPSITP